MARVIVANLADIEKEVKRQNVTSWAVKEGNYLPILGCKGTKLATIKGDPDTEDVHKEH